MKTSIAHRRRSVWTRVPAFLCLATILGLLAIASGEGWAQDEAEPPLTQGVDDAGARYPEVADALVRFRNRDFAGAKQLLDVARGKYTELPPTGVMMAQLYFAANLGAAGRAELELAVKTEPNDPEAYLLFGDLAIRERRVTDAEQEYIRANALCQNYNQSAQRKQRLQVRCLSGLTTVAESRQDWARAEAHLRELVKLEPEDVNANTRLARALFKQGGRERTSEAYKLLGANFERDNSVTRPEINMALLYHQDNLEPDLQKKLIQLAIDRGGNDLKTRLAAAQWALETGDVKQARTHAQKAVELDGDSLSAFLLLGLVARFERDYEAATTAFQQAHLMAPGNFSAINNLALSLIEQLDDQKRLRALEYAQLNSRAHSDLNQQNAREATATLAWIIFRLGKDREAEMTLQKLTQINAAVTAESAYFVAKILHARGKPQAALQVLRPALEKEGAFPERQDAQELLARLEATLNTTP